MISWYFLAVAVQSGQSRGVTVSKMESDEDAVKKTQLVEARARNISHNVRCIECGSQSIEDSQADIAILLRKVPFLLDKLQAKQVN